MGGKKFNKPQKPSIQKSTKVESDLDKTPLLSFQYYSKWDRFCMMKIKDFKKCNSWLLTFSTTTWWEIRTHKGLNYKPVKNCKKQPVLPTWLEWWRVFEFKAWSWFRVFWVPESTIFHILWFDEHHRICP